LETLQSGVWRWRHIAVTAAGVQDRDGLTVDGRFLDSAAAWARTGQALL
jgi:hypothetical protein